MGSGIHYPVGDCEVPWLRVWSLRVRHTCLCHCVTLGLCLKLSRLSFLHLEMGVTAPHLLGMVDVKIK